ncbi:MAG: type II toxin-antitoxin system VapC family toxin [Gemmatales bacterium]
MMPLFILDSDVLSDYQRQRPEVVQKVNSYPAGQLGVTIVSVIERLSGWYDEIKTKGLTLQDQADLYLGLADSVKLFSCFEIIPFSVAAMQRYERFRKMKPALNVRGPDLRIASITIENQATVITFNIRDFKRVPGLDFIGWERSTK